MTLFSFDRLASLGGQSSQSHALINFHMMPDGRGLPDHDAGAMIDKEILVDRSSRMDIDACQPVSMLCHNSRNQRNTHGKQFMGNPVNGDGVDSRIGVNNLFHAVSGGIAES